MDEKAKDINTTITEKIAEWLQENVDAFLEDPGSAQALAKRIARHLSSGDFENDIED